MFSRINQPLWHNGTASASKAEPFRHPGSIPGGGVVLEPGQVRLLQDMLVLKSQKIFDFLSLVGASFDQKVLNVKTSGG